MKKLLPLISAAVMCGLAFTSCSDDDTPTPPTPTTVTEGIFVVNEGTYGSIPGSLTSIGKDGSITQDAFAKANNGMALGDTPNDALVYGSKLYIVANGDNLVWVLDRNTLKIKEQINTTELMGNDKGKQPRCLLAAGQYVFLSTFDGYVAAIDTTTYEAAHIYQAGSYPEGMAVSNGNLYVANSDYGQNLNPSISIINLNTGEKAQDYTDELITNPQSIVTIGNSMYVLDSGWYDDNWTQHDAGIRKIENGKVTMLANASLMAANVNDGLLYIVNSPYSSTEETTYTVYDCNTGQTRTFITGDDIEYPAAIAVDPENGDVYISSYHVNADTGYADYSANGYVNQYRADGTFVTSYETGVGPTMLVFNYYTTNE